jgi:ankyrin repeat protein
MANVGADAPLHRACSDRNCSVDLIRQLIDEDPKALTKQDSEGWTPLHLACLHHRNSPEILHCLLDRCPPEAIGLSNSHGFTPLHDACMWGLSIEIIRRMILMHPKALRMLTNEFGDSPLHCACDSFRPSLDVIQLLASECPIVCLLNNSDGRTPYDQAVYFRRPAEALDFLLEATKQAALALLVVVDSAMITVSAVVVAHIHQVIPTFAQDYMSSNEPIRQALDDPQTLNDLINNNDLQQMLKDEDYQDVVCGMHRLIKASSRINLEIQLEPKHHISILESVSDTPDCFYIHLGNNPFLCCRSTRTTAAVIGAPPAERRTSAVIGVSSNPESSGRKRKARD